MSLLLTTIYKSHSVQLYTQQIRMQAVFLMSLGTVVCTSMRLAALRAFGLARARRVRLAQYPSVEECIDIVGLRPKTNKKGESSCSQNFINVQ